MKTLGINALVSILIGILAVYSIAPTTPAGATFLAVAAAFLSFVIIHVVSWCVVRIRKQKT